VDTLTQAVLGASIGAAVAGPGERRRGAAWGGACGTLPDLDVFVPLGNPVADFTWHRGYSHSLFVLSVAAPAIWWLISRLDSRARQRPRRWLALVWLALFTHPLLDAFTVYGTQLFLPFSNHPVSGSTLFIIDPAFTVPLAVGLAIALIVRDEYRARAAVVGGLTLAVAYLGLSVAAKLHVERVARDALAEAGIAHRGVLTTPAPFNIVLWRIVVMEEGGYREGFYSLLDPPGTLSFEAHESRAELLDGIRDAWAVQRLAWFTHGFYSVGLEGTAVVMTDLRMGAEPDYIFRFVVGELRNPRVAPTPARQLRAAPPLDRLGWAWRRIWHSGVTEESSPPL